MRQASEPITGQLRLAWWRDRFAEAPERWPEGEPLLARLAAWPAGQDQLGEVVDGWEALLVADRLSEDVAEGFAHGRSAGWAAAALALGEQDYRAATRAAGAVWSFADLAQHCASQEERLLVRAAAAPLAPVPRLPRSLRAFAVLGALAHRSLRAERPMLARPGDMAAAMRVGIFGR